MLDVREEIKDLYRGDSVKKSLKLYFPEIDLTIKNKNIFSESMALTESVCEEDELTFGGCNAAEFRITVADIPQDLSEQIFTVAQVLDNNPDLVMPLGTYKVKSCKRQSDRRFKEIIAYDRMLNLDKDVLPWYNSRQWPVTLKVLRESLLVFCNIPFEPQTLPNDGVMINKTIRPASLNGRDVMKRICELSGGFGHINRQDKFKVITLAGLGLYPSETLYPSEDLFPAESGEIIDGSGTGASYRPESTYEDYICRAIDQLRIRTNEDDTGVVVNDGAAGTNEYIVQGNFLISDKSKEELAEIAEALFLVIKNKYYRPHNMIVTGLPYLEVGDSILINTKDDVIESFIFSRTLTGIQALKDSLSATGYEYRQNKIGLDIQISQLEQTASDMQGEIEKIHEFNGKTEVRLQKTEQGIEAEVKRAISAEESLGTRVDMTEQSITLEAQRATQAESQLSAQLSVTAEEVSSKVTKGDVCSEINQSAEQIALRGNRLVVDSTNFQLDGEGNATFRGDVDGATVTAREKLLLRDAYDGQDKTALQSNQSDLYVGSGYDRTTVENALDVTGPIGCRSINTASINASSHSHSTGSTKWTDNGNDNCRFDCSGLVETLYAASTKWVLANFERKASSDFRLKRDIHSADEKIIDFLKRLKVKTYRFKDTTEDDRVHIGVLAQEVLTAMAAAGLDADFGIVEEYDTRHYKDEGMYTGGTAYRVNYEELSNMLLYGWQVQQKELEDTRREVSELKQLLTEKGVI